MAKATGYSDNTVRRDAAKLSEMSGAAFTSPAKCYQIERKRIALGDFDMEALRRFVHDFYWEKKLNVKLLMMCCGHMAAIGQSSRS